LEATKEKMMEKLESAKKSIFEGNDYIKELEEKK